MPTAAVEASEQPGAAAKPTTEPTERADPTVGPGAAMGAEEEVEERMMGQPAEATEDGHIEAGAPYGKVGDSVQTGADQTGGQQPAEPAEPQAGTAAAPDARETPLATDTGDNPPATNTRGTPAAAPEGGSVSGARAGPRRSQPSLIAGELSALEAADLVQEQPAQDAGVVASSARSLLRIAFTPFQLARALLGPAVHFRPPSTDSIPRCHQVGRPGTRLARHPSGAATPPKIRLVGG